MQTLRSILLSTILVNSASPLIGAEGEIFTASLPGGAIPASSLDAAFRIVETNGVWRLEWDFFHTSLYRAEYSLVRTNRASGTMEEISGIDDWVSTGSYWCDSRDYPQSTCGLRGYIPVSFDVVSMLGDRDLYLRVRDSNFVETLERMAPLKPLTAADPIRIRDVTQFDQGHSVIYFVKYAADSMRSYRLQISEDGEQWVDTGLIGRQENGGGFTFESEGKHSVLLFRIIFDPADQSNEWPIRRW